MELGQRYLAPAFGAVVALSACSGHHSDNPEQRSGTVVGQYHLVGGPAPGVARPQTGTIWAYEGQVKSSMLTTSTAVAHVRTDASGNFALSLRTGEYTLVGGEGQSDSAPPGLCGIPTVVHVKASARLKVDLVCSVP